MAKIQLTPAELLAQSNEMAALRDEYASLLNVTNTTLTSVNANWSENLARNFMAKMNSTKTGCERLVACLETGASLAKTSAQTFQSMDDQLAKVFGNLPGDSAVNDYFDKVSQQIKDNTAKGKKKTSSSDSGSSKKKKEEKNWWDKMMDKAEGMVDGVKTGVAKTVDLAMEGAEIIGDAIGDGISAIADSYNEKGVVYKLVKTGAAVVSTAGTCAAVVASWAAAAGTGGLGTGLAVTSTVYGVNTVINNFADIYNCWAGDVEQVGEVNVLKDGMNWVGEAIGGEIGGNIATGIYTAGNLVATVNNLTALAGKVTQLDDVALTVKNAASEVGTGVNGLIDIALHTDIANIPYDLALLAHEVPNIVGVSGLIGTAQEGISTVGKAVDQVIGVVGEFVDDVPTISGTVDKIVNGVLETTGLDDVKTVMNVVEKTKEVGEFVTDVIGLDKWRNVGMDKLNDAWNAFSV